MQKYGRAKTWYRSKFTGPNTCAWKFSTVYNLCVRGRFVHLVPKAYFWPDTKHGVQIPNRTPMPPEPFLCANPNPLKCYQFRLILKSLDRVYCFNWLQYSFASSYICYSTLCPQNLEHKQQKLLAQQAKPFCLRNSYPKIALFCTCVHKIMQDALLGVD